MKINKPAIPPYPVGLGMNEWQYLPPVTYPTDEITVDQWWDWDEDAHQADKATQRWH